MTVPLLIVKGVILLVCAAILVAVHKPDFVAKHILKDEEMSEEKAMKIKVTGLAVGLVLLVVTMIFVK